MNRKIDSTRDIKNFCQYSGTVSLFIRYLTRISIYFTKLFLVLGMSANQVTVTGLFVSLLAFILLCFGPPIWIIGILLMVFWHMMDCCDGAVSRYRGTSSLRGKWLDDRVGEVVPVIKWFGVTIAIYVMFPSLLVVLFGSLAIVFPRLRHMLKNHYKLLTKKSQLDKKTEEKLIASDKNKTISLISFVASKIGLRTEHILLVTMLLDLVIPPIPLDIVNLFILGNISFTFVFMIVFGIAESISYTMLVYYGFQKLKDK